MGQEKIGGAVDSQDVVSPLSHRTNESAQRCQSTGHGEGRGGLTGHDLVTSRSRSLATAASWFHEMASKTLGNDYVQ